MRAEVSHPIRSTPLRRGGVSVGGRRLWRCSAGDGARPDYEAARRGNATPAAGTARRVLVVDDERSIRLLCRVNLVASFHPELTDDTRVHELFLDLVREEANVRA